MRVPEAKSWARIVVSYWLLMAAVFTLELRYIESDWAGLPGCLLTLPLSLLVVVAGLLPVVAGHFGYKIPFRMNDYHFEYGFIACALLNALILYPLYLLWKRRNIRPVFDAPPPPDNSSNRGPS